MKQVASPEILIIILSLILYSCSSVKVSSTKADVDFSAYETIEYMGWSEQSREQVDQADRERIERSFGTEFRNRDFEIVEEGGDLEVSLFLVLDVETITAEYIAYHNGYYGIGNLGPSARMPVEDYDVVEGTLIIDVFDADSQTLVWQGIGMKTVNPSPKNREKKTPKSVAKIMSEFPVKPE